MLCPSLRDLATTHSTLNQDKEEFINRRGEQKYPTPLHLPRKVFPTNALKKQMIFLCRALGRLKGETKIFASGN